MAKKVRDSASGENGSTTKPIHKWDPIARKFDPPLNRVEKKTRPVAPAPEKGKQA